MSARWYGLQRWRRRSLAQLRAEPLCAMCLQAGRTTAASVADHVVPHRGDEEAFWNGKLQSLCDHCHSQTKQREEARGYGDAVGEDGWPLDPRHPANGGAPRANVRPPRANAQPPGGVKSLGPLAPRPAATPARGISRNWEEGVLSAKIATESH